MPNLTVRNKSQILKSNYSDSLSITLEAIEVGLKSVNPVSLMKNSVKFRHDCLRIFDFKGMSVEYDTRLIGSIYLIGAGKATAAMADDNGRSFELVAEHAAQIAGDRVELRGQEIVDGGAHLLPALAWLQHTQAAQQLHRARRELHGIAGRIENLVTPFQTIFRHTYSGTAGGWVPGFQAPVWN